MLLVVGPESITATKKRAKKERAKKERVSELKRSADRSHKCPHESCTGTGPSFKDLYTYNYVRAAILR